MRFATFALIALSIGLFADTSHVSAQGSRSARVIAEKANLRQIPSVQGLAEGEVTQGTIVKILDEKLPWYVVRVGDRVGWMHGATLQFVTEENVGDQQRPVRLSATPDPTPITPRDSTAPKTRIYIRGPRGGCYYLTSSGRKVYVDRSLCD